MERSASWPISVAAIGSILVTVATLLVHIQAHRAGQSGGYLPIILGAISVGLLVSGCDYFARPPVVRTRFASVLTGALASLTFTGVLLTALILGFGS
jgi:hypothetical protein